MVDKLFKKCIDLGKSLEWGGGGIQIKLETLINHPTNIQGGPINKGIM